MFDRQEFMELSRVQNGQRQLESIASIREDALHLQNFDQNEAEVQPRTAFQGTRNGFVRGSEDAPTFHGEYTQHARTPAYRERQQFTNFSSKKLKSIQACENEDNSSDSSDCSNRSNRWNRFNTAQFQHEEEWKEHTVDHETEKEVRHDSGFVFNDFNGQVDEETEQEEILTVSNTDMDLKCVDLGNDSDFSQDLTGEVDQRDFVRDSLQ